MRDIWTQMRGEWDIYEVHMGQEKSDLRETDKKKLTFEKKNLTFEKKNLTFKNTRAVDDLRHRQHQGQGLS